MKYFFILILLYQTLFALDNKKELEHVSLQLHWKYQFEFAGFIAAKEKGYYKEAGLDVTLKEYEFGVDIEKDLLDGKSDFAIYNSLSLLEYLRGKPLVLVSSYFKRAALVLVTTPDIKSPRDLIGKKVMAATKDDFILNYQPYFDGYDVDVDDIILVPHSYGIEEFAEGKVSAMTAFVSNELYKLDERGIKYNVLDPSDDNLYVLQLELITSKKEAEAYPKRVEAFKKASLKGWKYALKHKEELVSIIYEKYSHKMDKKSIMQEAIGVEKLILPFTYDIGSIDKNFLRKQLELFKEYYHVGKEKSLNGFLFEELSHKRDLLFTKEEKEYIKNAKPLRLCLQYDQFPIDGYEKGKFVGIMSDIYKIISEKSSLVFEPIVPNSLEELHSNVKNEKCDLLSIYSTGNPIYKNLKPTHPFIHTHFTLISELNKSFISTPKDLIDVKLLTRLPSYKNYLLHLYPYLDIEVVTDKNRMVKKLLHNKAYALITLDEQADYIIDKYGYGKLKINGFLAKEKPINGSIGVNKNNPLLYSIIEKSLSKISQNQLFDIINSWRLTRYQSVTDYSLFYKALVIVSIIFLIMFYYHTKLKNFNRELEVSVNEKTKALREINEYLEEMVAEKVDELIRKDEILTAQSKQAVMGEMISMIAHQWRQPLNMITLNISNLQIKQMLGEKIEDKVLKKTFDEISETIVYLSETVDDFKTYFHPNKERSVVQIDEIIQKAVNFVLPRFKANKIELHMTEISKEEIKVYPNELIQVLLNILNNAIDAYEKSQNENKYVSITTTLSEGTLVISIKDEAGGIAQENIGKLFEPYFSTKGKNGTGLGLYMSQMIIEKQFNGVLEVQSQESSTTFTIKLPKVVSV
jgi:signal transduction histidine kinase/ABC-type nitrate/sulfonate/bicarbonate transport system substrate-binding protein